MGSSIAIVYEGALHHNQNDGPITAGLLLYHAATAVGQVALLVDETSTDKVNHWLGVHGLRAHSWLMEARPGDPEDPAERRLSQVSRLRLQGASVDLVLEPNPTVAAALQGAGVSTALFLHPRYARPEFRPDYESKKRPWSAVVEEVERQAMLQESDTRPNQIL